MRTINRLLTEEGLHQNNCAFVDDLTSHDATFESSLCALRAVLSALRKSRMYLAPPGYVGVILSFTFSVTSFPKIKFDANQAK